MAERVILAERTDLLEQTPHVRLDPAALPHIDWHGHIHRDHRKLAGLDVTDPPDGRRGNHHARACSSPAGRPPARHHTGTIGPGGVSFEAQFSRHSGSGQAHWTAPVRHDRPHPSLTQRRCVIAHPAQMMTRRPSRTRIPGGQGPPGANIDSSEERADDDTEATQPADPLALLRTRGYLALPVLAAILGVPIAALAFGCLKLVDVIQKAVLLNCPAGSGSTVSRCGGRCSPLPSPGCWSRSRSATCQGRAAIHRPTDSSLEEPLPRSRSPASSLPRWPPCRWAPCSARKPP